MWFSFSSMSCVSSCIHSLLWGICSSGCLYVYVSLMSSLVPGLRCTESEMWVISLCDFLCHLCIIISCISFLWGNWDFWVSGFLCEFSFQLNQSPGLRRSKRELWVSVGFCKFMQSSLEVQENLKCGLCDSKEVEVLLPILGYMFRLWFSCWFSCFSWWRRQFGYGYECSDNARDRLSFGPFELRYFLQADWSNLSVLE